MMEEEDESPCDFFTKRARLIPKKSAEELQAAAELLAKIEKEESSEASVKSVKRTVSSKSRSRRNPKKKDQISPQKNREDSIDDFLTDIKLSSASKKRLKKLQSEQLEELERIEAENKKILSMDINFNYTNETIKETIEDVQKHSNLTIMYLSKIARVKCLENDKFLDIFPKVAELFNLKVSEFLLCLETRNIAVDDTPKSLGLTDKDILECIPYKADDGSKLDAEDTRNTLMISFQSNDIKEKTEMLIYKGEKMQEIMKRYSEQRKIPLDELVFHFDGEKISGEETPIELDMESESCIDVTVLEPSSKVTKI